MHREGGSVRREWTETERKRAAQGAGAVAAGICGAIGLACLAVILILNCRMLYLADIRLLSIEAYSGMSRDAILRNYDALITYNRLLFRGPLVFPDLPMSRTAEIHFAEVKRIFDAVQILCPAALVPFVRALTAKGTRKKTLRTAGTALLAAVAAVGLCGLVGWDRFFVGFHSLLFNNDYWLFDPKTDPVIMILPDTYFLHCAVGIVLLILIAAVVCLVTGRKGRQERNKKSKER